MMINGQSLSANSEKRILETLFSGVISRLRALVHKPVPFGRAIFTTTGF